MVSTSSKVMTVRVPLPEYIDILQTASAKGMTISDYVLELIYCHKHRPQQINSTGVPLVSKSRYNIMEEKYKNQISMYEDKIEKLNIDYNKLVDKCQNIEDRREFHFQECRTFKEKIYRILKYNIPAIKMSITGRDLMFLRRVREELETIEKLLREQ